MLPPVLAEQKSEVPAHYRPTYNLWRRTIEKSNTGNNVTIYVTIYSDIEVSFFLFNTSDPRGLLCVVRGEIQRIGCDPYSS